MMLLRRTTQGTFASSRGRLVHFPALASIHTIAEEGFSESSAQLYDEARPGYPAESITYIKDLLISVHATCNNSTSISREAHATPQIVVVELGAGTGKFTQCFFAGETKHTAQAQDALFNWTATDPSAGFRAAMKGISLPRDVTAIVEGTGTSIPADDHSVDCIVVAQAFHWMANEETLMECHRVLKRSGALIMVWNAMDAEKDWIRQLDFELLTSHYDDKHTPRYITNEWRDVFGSTTAQALFQLPLVHWSAQERNKQHGSKQSIVDKILSVSVVSRRSAHEKEAIAREVQEFLENHPETAAKARLDQALPLEYRTDVSWLVTK